MKRYRIQTLGGAFEDEREVLAAKARRSKTRPERLINGHGNWPDFTFKPEEQAALEKRDALAMQGAAERKARGEALPCPQMRYSASFERGEGDHPAPDTIIINAQINSGSGWKEAGGIYAERKLPRGHFIVESASTPLELLATCPGLGTGLYEAAAKEACKHGSTIAGSAMRSAFSERFWKRQVTKGRAKCGTGKAELYQGPNYVLRQRLLEGKINVPQFNALVRGLPEKPPNGEWPCKHVPLTKCRAESLRGIRRR